MPKQLKGKIVFQKIRVKQTNPIHCQSRPLKSGLARQQQDKVVGNFHLQS